jgi:phage N-6-adenine-methyltransferase
MKNDKVHFSSKTCVWETPHDLFECLNDEFQFTVDVCALPENAKCEHFYGPDVDGLAQEWAGSVWCNPPYGDTMKHWVRKSLLSSQNGATVVLLIPARTCTPYWHNEVTRASEIRLIKGRLRFVGDNQISNAPFPSAVVVFRPGYTGSPVWSSIDRQGRPIQTPTGPVSSQCRMAFN